MIVTLLEGARTIPSLGELVECSGSEFIDLIADEAGCPVVICKNEEEKKAGAGFVCAKYVKNAASKSLKMLADDSETEVFVYDIDEMDEDDLTEALPLWAEYSCLLYSTYKHTANNPRYRLILELSRPVPNREKEPFYSTYIGTAQSLDIKMDPKTVDRARFFFGPQAHIDHADEAERHRFHGVPFDVDSISVAVKEPEKTVFDVAGDRPAKSELKKLAARWRGSSTGRMKSLASALDAILRGEAYAPNGSIHNTSMELAFELVREYRNLDPTWFAENWLKIPWSRMGTLDFAGKLPDWENSVESAKAKHDSIENEKKGGALPASLAERARKMEGRLVMSMRGSYFVYSPELDRYEGPYKAAEVPVVVRDLLGGVRGVTETEMSRGGPVLKSAVKINHEYGGTCDSAVFFPGQPPAPYDEESNGVCLQAYRWIDWQPVFHQEVDDLLHAVGGRHYPLLEAYLYKFRDLTQPLPALTLVGPKGCWKSRLCAILSRFWTTRHAESYGRAEKIMTRFNEHLRVNPVVWSDEQLAVTAYGKPQPEAYRESVTSKTQQIEFKGVSGLSTLMSAIRHVISVNDDEKIFSSEVDANSVHATMERFLVLYADTEAIEAVERKWLDTPEMDRMRAGDSVLEHVRWIEENREHVSNGRLFIQPHTDARILMRARFSDELLLYIWSVAIDAFMGESGFMSKKSMERLPFYFIDGKAYLSPARICDLWSVARATAGSGMKKPTARRINTIMEKAGFKAINGSRRPMGAWEIDLNTFKEFIGVSDISTMEEINAKLGKIEE